MRLKISNFAKIKEADIVIDGITVIAGENNTGKSTIGKILFSLFNSMSGIEDKIAEQRLKEIENTCRLNLSDYYRNSSHGSNYPRNLYPQIRKIKNEIKDKMAEDCVFDFQCIFDILNKELRNGFDGNVIEERLWQDAITELANKLISIMALSEDTIILEMLSRYFSRVFCEQINSLYDKNSNAELGLDIKEKSTKLMFSNNKCSSYRSESDIIHQAIYIDNPFVIDNLSEYSELNAMDDFLVDLLTDTPDSDIMGGIIESVLIKEKLDEVYKALDSVVDGRIIEKSGNEFYLEREGFTQPVYFSNLSTGLKSFVILKMLIERGILKEKDVLILDEPEIHLHPQWQIVYAELIVLLQQKFDLTIVVTTHSPYFLDAINIFSVKHKIGEKVNYYLAEEGEKGVAMELVSDKIELIYQKMVSPIQVLDSLRYELNNN